jgi:beta-lactamase class D
MTRNTRTNARAPKPLWGPAASWAWIAASCALGLTAVFGAVAVYRGQSSCLERSVLLFVAGKHAALQLALAPILIGSLTARPRREIRTAQTAFLVTVCAAFGIYVSLSSTHGAWVQHQPWLWPLRGALAVLPLVIFFALFASLPRLASRRTASRRLLGAGLAAVGVAASAVDAAVLCGEYEGAHLFVAACASAAAWYGVRLASLRAPTALSTSGRWRGALVALAPLALLALATGSWLSPPASERARLAAAGMPPPLFDSSAPLFLRNELELVARGEMPPRWQSSRPERAPGRGSTAGTTRRNALVICIDALRADVLDQGGRDQRQPWQRVPLGAFERHWRRAIRFTAAYTPATTTHKALRSLLLTRPPFEERRGTPGFVETLSQSGWDDFAVVWDWLADDEAGEQHDAFREALSQFHVVEPYPFSRSGEAFSKTLARVKAARARPFFGWMHVAPPHEPGFDGAPIPKLTAPGAAYARSLRWLFPRLGEFFDSLEAWGALDDTIVVLTADHGEGLGDHGQDYHGFDVFDASARVPFAWWIPGEPAREVPRRVSTLDLGPTLLAALGVAEDGARRNAWARPDLLSNPADDEVVLCVEGFLPGEVAWIDARHSLIRDWGTRELLEFDLERDPHELSPRSASETVEDRRLLWAFIDTRPDLLSDLAAGIEIRELVGAALTAAERAGRQDVARALERLVGAAPSTSEVVDLSSHLAGLEGAFVLYDRAADRYLRHNPARAAQRFSPCSTFKIPNSLVALDTGVATGAEFAIPWDPVKDPPQPWWDELGLDWKRGHTLATAFRNSVVWYYQELARRIGAKRMDDYLARFGYGNRDTSAGIDEFWLSSTLRISADEQVEFLRRFYDGRLGVSEEATRVVKEIMVLERGDGWTLSAKTGSGTSDDGRALGWLVGYVERSGNVYFFALNLSGDDPKLVRDARKPAAKEILKALGTL